MFRICFLTVVLSVCASSWGDGLSARFFGLCYDDARKNIAEMLGKAAEVSGEDGIRYKDVEYDGMMWDEACFRFTDGVLTEARFYSVQTSKAAALRYAETIALKMGKEHSLSKDYEDRRTFFYKGGRSPMDFGHLFTIFVSPYRGGWSTQLRYGPFLKLTSRRVNKSTSC